MPLTKCPDCGSAVSTEAPTCPKCGRPLTAQAQIEVRKYPWYYSNWFIILGLLFCLPIGIPLMWAAKRWALWVRILVTIVGVIAFFSVLASDSDKPSPSVADIPSVPKKTILDESFADLDALFGVDSDLTELQKDELWKTYKGKYVRWTGEVSYIDESMGGISVGFRHKPGTLTYDVLARFPMSEKGQLLRLKEGEIVKYTGRLDTRGGAILPYNLNDPKLL